MPRSTRKRPADSEASLNPEEMDVQESSDDEVMLDGDGSVESADDPINTKMGILLRSGKRKRRRSAGTSGLTPPEGSMPKKARTTGIKGTRRPPHGRRSMVETRNREQASLPPSVVAARPRRASTTGRVSLLDSDPSALRVAQDPEQSLLEDFPLPIAASDDSNRRLFDSKPPSMPEAGIPAATSEEKQTGNTIPEHATPQISTINTSNGDHDEPLEENVLVKGGRKALFLRIFFLISLTSSSVFMWPLCVLLADFIIPLRELVVPDLPDIPKLEVVAVNDDEVPESLVQSLEKLVQKTKYASEKKVSIERGHRTLKQTLEKIVGVLEGKESSLEHLAQWKESERALSAAIEETNKEASSWKEARESAALLGHVILDASTVDLWAVQDLADCPLDATDTNTVEALQDASTLREEDPDPPISLESLEEELTRIKQRLDLSVDSVKGSPHAEKAIRSWVRTQLESVLEGDSEAAVAIADLSQALEDAQNKEKDRNDEELDSEIFGMEAIEEIVEDRLEIARADRTGEFDHASLQNGAKIIVGGKRGTSKSLVDYLPLFNRLLHFTQLRFYGHGPEAALSPTYPLDALGQCWSFQQTPLKELLKERKRLTDDEDDHKRGNFGTLTVSLPNPVTVSSVVIEHPPRGLTDHVASAIRSFRVIGYEDAEASNKPWLLGSFEYDINSTNPLQEFEVSMYMPIHAITLAIDSNWGHDYACLYRFRVHGDEEKPTDEGAFVRR